MTMMEAPCTNEISRAFASSALLCYKNNLFCIFLIIFTKLVIVKISEGPEHALSHFWITDSCPLTVEAVKDRRPFEILSLADSIASALQI
ncbi:unnamed protein product [Triticum turgidum subsp. durum]|uniref:Uncharacterized protein n=1 Tax=Triticum turgidum subsp. durum TaxID=4567 RepID=A0A9R0RQ51_TRITD|nr:unnamed protein product [Triticum turgidum subsp. durum]